jgi:hypothetical protein
MDDSDVYVVAYTNGSCGSFITAMVERMVQPNLVRMPLRGNKYNNCHRDILTSNYKFELVTNQRIPDKNVKSWYQKLEIRIPGKPVFIPTHYYSPKEMLNRFPNAKSIVILHDRDDIEEISINSFFKFIIGDNAYLTDHAARKNFDWFREHISFIFDSMDIARPEDIPKELYPVFVELQSSSVITSGFHLMEVKPEYEHCVFPIRYKDIVRNPVKVLQQLSNFTGMPITDFVKEQYYGYVERQKKFLEDTRKLLNNE